MSGAVARSLKWVGSFFDNQTFNLAAVRDWVWSIAIGLEAERYRRGQGK
jgi:hypothetical protein